MTDVQPETREPTLREIVEWLPHSEGCDSSNEERDTGDCDCLRHHVKPMLTRLLDALALCRRERDEARRRSDEGHAAHAHSFGALAAISSLTHLQGEVDEYDGVVKAVAALTQRVAATEADAKRLDWLEAQKGGGVWHQDSFSGNPLWMGWVSITDSTPKPLREAIDAALSGTAERSETEGEEK